MSKLLSICIPSFNMEEYLSRCVDSMLVDEVLDQLEIIIVNDGSKDGTLAIANDYKQRYPQSVVVIDKPNGHYGSCINASLKVATGKYFRIVDADDWVDSQALAQLVKKLNDLDVDCVCTKYATRWIDGMDVQPLDVPFNEILDLNQYVLPIPNLRMHGLIYSTNLLRNIDYVQTEGICYTDTEYLYIPLSCAQNIFFMDIVLYQYYVARDGQSMDTEQRIKNDAHFYKIMEKVDIVHGSNLPFNENEPRIWSFIQSNIIEWCAIVYIFFFEFDHTKENALRRVIAELRHDNALWFSGLWSKKRMAIFYLWYFSGEKLSKVIMQPFRKLKR